MTDHNRLRILAELTDRAQRDFQLRIDAFDREQAARTAAISDERKKQLNLTPEHYRKHREFMQGQRASDRKRLEDGILFFATFSSEVLVAFDEDLQNDGPFSKAHGISKHDGEPEHYKSWVGGTARFISASSIGTPASDTSGTFSHFCLLIPPSSVTRGRPWALRNQLA